MTFPARPDDVAVLDPAPDDRGACAWHYDEGLFVGYRHFDRHGLEPAYCFGHGLGYTRFAYEELRVRPTERGGVEAVVRVRNVGERRGKEVVQLYAGWADPARPRRELKAFRPVELDPGAEAEVTFVLVERPDEIAVGRSSRDLPLRETVESVAELVPDGGVA